jgi:hypothetical protein
MKKKILSEMSNEKVILSIRCLILDNKRIGDKGMEIICSQPTSHVTSFHLGKANDRKMRM